jgi:microcystin degradation protein MlrC
MSARIGIAGFMQESNSFAPRLAEVSDFQVISGEGLVDFFEGTNSEVAGFLDGCALHGWRPVPSTFCGAISGGPLSGECFEALSARILESIDTANLDGLLLALHGAMSTERFSSGDAEFARRVRARIGRRLPLVVSHDYHANVNGSLFTAIDGIAGYRTYPHIDMRDTGVRAANILASVLEGRRPILYYLPIPLLLPPEPSTTFEPPLRAVIERLRVDFSEPDGQHANLYSVQPWLDFTPVASSVVVTDFSHADSIPAKIKAVASHFWKIRRELPIDWTTPDTLISRIQKAASPPVLISEAFDSPTAGASGDNPGLLSVLLPHAGEFSSCLYLVDPDFAAHAHANLHEGDQVEATLGARIDKRFAPPVTVKARVERLTDGEFIAKGPAFNGRRFFMGPCVVLAIQKMRMLVASKPVMMIDPELYRSQGIDPAEQDVVGVKSALLFRAAYESISRTVLFLDMPGSCLGRLEVMPFEKINRPIYPLDDLSWDADAAVPGQYRR